MRQADRRVRVLVVDDSPVQREMLCHLLALDGEIDVVGSAGSGAEALLLIARLHPDIVTLDERMPAMSGLETARHIMQDTPTPIVMISSAAGAEAQALEQAALAAGVLAVQDKRALAPSESDAARTLVRLIKGMAAVRTVRRRRDPSAAADQAAPREDPPAAPDIVAIGASTGGPEVLRALITGLPALFAVPVVVVQHTTAGSSRHLADWLQIGARLPVRIAEDGMPLVGGCVYLAPTERHMIVEGAHLRLLEGPPVSLHQPSVTVLFHSVAATFGERSIGILLTGMGDDGAAGLLHVQRAGGLTIAQDEATCVVFGMPAEAIRQGAADFVLPPSGISSLLAERVAAEKAAA